METATALSLATRLRNSVSLWLIFALSLSLQFDSLAQQPPNITYTTPNVYPVNSPMTLSPTNTGGEVGRSIRGRVTHVAGAINGTSGNADGQGTTARFREPGGLAVDAAGNLFVADRLNNSIRKITPDGTVTTFANTGFNLPWGIEIHPVTGDIYVSNDGDHRIMKITPSGSVSVFAGTGTAGSTDGPAAIAKFYLPHDLAFDRDGNLYVADSGNKLVRKITPQGVVSTIAGSGAIGKADGTGTAASFDTPAGLTLDKDGNILIADFSNNLIRKMTPGGVVTTFAGTSASGFSDGPAATAIFDDPTHMATDYLGNIYISDSRNDRIRKISPAGVVTTIIGNPAFGPNKGDEIGDPLQVLLNTPVGLAYDKFANLYITDEYNHKIKKLALGGWVLSGPSLPQGMTFDSTTGIISGTPTQLQQQTDYTVTAYNGYGEDSFRFTIRVIPTAVYLIPFSPVTICEDDIDPAGLSNLPLKYTSSNPNVAKITANNMIEVVGIGKTLITAFNSLGQDTASLSVSDFVIPEILSVKSDKAVLCPGANATLSVTTSMAGKAPTYQWFLNGQPIPGATDKTYSAINPSLNDKFTVQVTNHDQCYLLISKMSDPVLLSPVPPPPTTSITMTPAGPTCAGTVLSFKAEVQGPIQDTGPRAKWYVNGKDAGNTSLIFSSDQLKAGDVVKYVLPYNNPCGPAQAASSNEIVVEYRKAELCNIMPPKAFSPNGDGVNDTWKIEYLAGFPNCHIRVFSRYGQKLYDATGYGTPWDGSSNGQSLPAGTYYYVIALEKDMETVSGAVTIIK